jgi:hypothetical protein
MKHNIYGISYLRPFSSFSYLKDLFRGLFRTSLSNPKTIWYSLRYNAGEKFILKSKHLYPYKYQFETLESDPVLLSNGLMNSIENLQVFNFQNKYMINKTEFSHEATFKIFNNNFYELYKSYEYNIENKKFDIPVAVSARTLYAISFFNTINFKKNAFIKINESELKDNTIDFILDCFFKKLTWADSENISQVIYFLAQTKRYDEKMWNSLIEALIKNEFEAEYTSVRTAFPLFFAYEENSKKDFESFITNEEGNEIFVRGMKTICEVYNSLLKVENIKGINSQEMIKTLERKFPNLKNYNFKF